VDSGNEIWDYGCGDAWIIVVRGELDVDSSGDLREALARADDEGASWFLVDLEETTFMDPFALGILVGAAKKARARQGGLRIVSPSQAAARLLHVKQMDRVFPVDTDLMSAYANVLAPTPPKKGSGIDAA
jgi:anti-anti-sigma factor